MKYPYIGYWEATELTVLFVANREGFEIEEDGSYSCEWSEHEYTNITRDYLQNTYGQVQSPEHAEFIAKLCESNGIELFNNYDEGITQFAINRGELIFTYIKPAISDHDKQITIPLPPKQIQTATPEEEFEITQIMKNAGDNLVLGCEDSKCDEWPQVNSEVQTSVGAGTIRLMPDKLGHFIVEIDGVFCSMNIEQLSKPKTPEEELRDDIKQEVFSSFLVMPELLTKRDVVIEVSERVANNLVKKYITKKPQ